MADPGVGFGSEGTPLEERPPMVVGYGSTAQPQKESFWDRLPGRGGPSIGDRLLRTPIHREVTALVAAGAILLIGAALFLAQRSAGQETTQGEITSDAVDGEGARSNGLFGGLFGGDDEDQAEEPAAPLEVETSASDAPESQDAESEASEPEDGEPEQSNAEQPSTSETAEDSESPDPTASKPTSAPTTAEPTPTQPTPTEPPQTQVTQTEPTATQPPPTQPPATQPRPTQPPATEPPPPPGAGERYRKNLLPGRIQAEFFDSDGDGLAYNDTDAANFGDKLRTFQSVDVFQTNAGDYYVGRTRSDEWLEYTVTVEDTGKYVIAVNVSSNQPDPGRLGVFIDGKWTAGFDVPSTGGNGNWVELQSAVKNIEAGVHVIRLKINEGGKFNIDWFAVREA